jgi:signal peptide peptidase SppA
MLPELPNLWAGTDDSWEFFLKAYARAEATLQAKGSASADPFELPPTFTVQDGVGIVPVKGPLISGSAGFLRFFGVTGYSDIQDGVLGAATSKGVKAIMLDVATGGGAVEGADETSTFIADIGKLKPVVTFASGNMLSAGIWVGSAGQRLLASQTSLLGSIGAMMVHTEYSKQRTNAGITDTVIRSGKWKALGTPVEPLSKEAQDQLQTMVQDIASIFESRFADNMGLSIKAVHDKMGQGRVFLGARGQEVGLVHGIATAQEAFAVAKILGGH